MIIDNVEIAEQDLLWRVLHNLRPRRKGQPRWVAVHEALAYGSTVSRELCLRCNLDPDELLK